MGITPIKTPSIEQLEKRLCEKEQELTVQLDRIYALIEKKQPTALLQIEYRRAVERITEKYHLLFALLELQKEKTGTAEAAEYEERAKALGQQYKDDLVMLAVAIDEANGISAA